MSATKFRRRKVVLVPLRRLIEHSNPYDGVWDTPDIGRFRITLQQVRKCIALRKFEPKPFSPATDCESWTLHRHACRVAYLAVNGWSDPIHLDVGVPSLGCNVDWLIEDGNHRTAAALARGDDFIESIISGSHRHSFELLGVSPR
ncbi:hypothetical protein ABIC83_002982 [Roseateles asaccharophilus]|uniref:hypothetical protein n=1 Tax=Roseateles asaccharophilus TaxID=582607 RepID=UPI003838C256